MNIDLLSWPGREEHDLKEENILGFAPALPGLIGIISCGACILLMPSRNIHLELMQIFNGIHPVCPVLDPMDGFAFEVMDFDLAAVRASELAGLPQLS